VGIFDDLSDRETDRMLSGITPTRHSELATLAACLKDASRTLPKVPAASTQQRHLAAIVQASRVATRNSEMAASAESKANRATPHPLRSPRWRNVMDGTRSTALKLSVGIVAASMSMAGLAFAGVTLPSQATAAFHKLGLSLPNQAQGSNAPTTHGKPSALPSPTSHGQTVSAFASSGSGGCSFGQSVAAIARSKRKDNESASPRRDASHRINPCEQASPSPESSETEKASSGTNSHAPGYGKDNHPSNRTPNAKPTDDGTLRNPTGYGRDSHPSGSTASIAGMTGRSHLGKRARTGAGQGTAEL
jgi:hypothetical protein